jgi:hypothetical protein
MEAGTLVRPLGSNSEGGTLVPPVTHSEGGTLVPPAPELPCRFDVVGINTLTNPPAITLIQDAFRPGW